MSTSSHSRHPQDLTESVIKNDFLPHKTGQYGDLYRGTYSNASDSTPPKVVALKTLRGLRTKDQSRFADFQQRTIRWAEFDHPNIAKVYGFTLDFGPSPTLVMDLYINGNVVQYVNENRCSFDQRLAFAHEIADGLQYLHSFDPPIVHGDLRGANVFITQDHPRAVIADYEVAFLIDAQIFTTSKLGATVRWTAPELTLITEEDINDENYQDPQPNHASDIFAFAMTMLEVFTGEQPFAAKKKETTVMRLYSEGERPEIPQEIEKLPWLAKLFKDCWMQDQLARPTAAQVKDTFVTHAKKAQQSSGSFGIFSSIWSYVWGS